MYRWMTLAFCLFTQSLLASFPQTVNVQLREKMSCREIKRLFKKERLHIHCDSKNGLLQSFSADYFGKGSLENVIKELSLEARVDKVSQN